MIYTPFRSPFSVRYYTVSNTSRYLCLRLQKKITWLTGVFHSIHEYNDKAHNVWIYRVLSPCYIVGRVSTRDMHTEECETALIDLWPVGLGQFSRSRRGCHQIMAGASSKSKFRHHVILFSYCILLLV